MRVLAVVGLLAAAGCTETELVAQTAKELQGRQRASVPPQVGYYKVGTPYTISGITYTPAEDYQYVEVGVASWYGQEFHGKRTANGEVFDMNSVSAAHRTLPLPSVVRVTNLENGRSLDLRVNDRGPFVNNRILDVSRRGAQLLGFHGRGTTQVKVEILPLESRQVADLARLGDLSTPVVATAPPPQDDARPVEAPKVVLAAATPMVEATGAKSAPVGGSTQTTGLFVQAGAFTEYANAARVRDNLARLGHSRLSETMVGATKYYRVRVGPSGTQADADRLLAQIVAAGHREARLIAE